jgi:hypothetical protein
MFVHGIASLAAARLPHQVVNIHLQLLSEVLK